METIKEYLDNLFLGFPEIPAVHRAKAELLEMMEDKYEECLKEGMSETEAVGTVISEFGNIEELAEELGISDYLREKQQDNEGENGVDTKKDRDGNQAHDDAFEDTSTGSEKKGATGEVVVWSFSQAKDYVTYAWKHGWMIGVGVALFICNCFLNSVIDDIERAFFWKSDFMELLGSTVFFLGIAAGVLVLVFAGRLKMNYPVVEKGKVLRVDSDTAEYMKKQRDIDEEKRFRLRLTGILLMIFSVVPSSSSQLISKYVPFLGTLFDDSFFLFVAIGVMLVIVSASVGNRYKEFANVSVVSSVVDLKKTASRSGLEGEVGEDQEFFREDDFDKEDKGHKVFEEERKKGKSRGAGWIVAAIIGAAVLFIGFDFIVFLHTRMASLPGGIENSAENAKSQSGKEFHESYPINDIRDIQVNLSVADVRVMTADVETLAIDYKGEEKLTSYLKNGILEVKEQESHGFFFHFHLFSFGNHEGSLEITLPESAFGSPASLDGGKKLSVDTDTGDVELKDVYFDQVSVDADTGDVYLEHVGGVKKGVSIDVDTGEVTLSDVTGEKVVVDADTGDVNVRVSEQEVFGSLECELDTGDFTLEVPMGKERFLETFATDFSMDLENKIRFFGTGMTEKEASKKRQGSEPLIKVAVDTGRITIEEAK